MGRSGDVYENRVTGEHALLLRGDEDGGGEPYLVLLTVAVGGAVVGTHVHPHIQERFRVLTGRLQVLLDGERRTLAQGEEATAPAGVAHDWWNAGDEPARVLLEISPPERRFEMMIATMFGLANDGKTNHKGMPNPLQLSLIGREFDDIIQFTKPPRMIQKALMAALAPIARYRGYSAIYPSYVAPHRHIEPDPGLLAEAGLAVSSAPIRSSPPSR